MRRGAEYSIVERVSRCLTHVLQQQDWCCVRDGASIFVSAVNPEQWQSDLSTGKCTDKQQNSQLSHFKNHSIYCNELSIYSLTIFITMKTLGLSSTPQLKMRKPTGDSHTKCLCSIDEWQLLLASVDQSLTLPVPLDGQKLSSYGSDNCFFSFLPILHSRLGLLLSWRAQLPP